MLTLRGARERGYADHGWLNSFHSFSFAGYFDPEHVSFGNLRVINEDRISGGSGFGTHGHRDMEIISYVIDGALAHKDDIGNGTSILPGDVQRMSAGRGVKHSEFNHSKDHSTHFLQIWIQPNKLSIEPGYEQKNFPDERKRGRLCLVASPDGEAGSVSMSADAKLYAGLFDDGEKASLQLDEGRKYYVHVVRGQAIVSGQLLNAGDALKFEQETSMTIANGKQSEILVFDLANA